jgi:hypothetical protein
MGAIDSPGEGRVRCLAFKVDEVKRGDGKLTDYLIRHLV